MCEIELKPGMNVKLLDGNQEIDEGVIESLSQNDYPIKIEITFRSKKLFPGTISEFALLEPQISRAKTGPGWFLLFNDPLTHQRCYSKKGPSYTISLI